MIQKLYLYMIITLVFFIYLCITITLGTNKQLINHLYNDVKNLTSILSCCIGPMRVSSNNDTKALFLCELHFSLFVTIRPLNHQRKNKQLITLLYNEMKSLSSILSCCNGVNIVPSKERLKSIMSVR